jgi:hypothetical protein
LSAGAERLLFDESVISASIEVTLSGGNGAEIKKRVTLMECQQRWSVQYGILDTGRDVAWSTVTGRMLGCTLTGDWWIRAVPMYEDGPISNGHVRLTDGSFSVPVGTRGGRHILVIGKDRTPVKVLGFDVVAGGKNDTGVVDLSGSCPK